MAHKTRSEQHEFKVRKDPRKLAKQTRIHKPKPQYKRINSYEVMETLNENSN